MKHRRVVREKPLDDPVGHQGRLYLCLTRYIREKLHCMDQDMTISTLAAHEIDHFLKDMLQMVGEAVADLLTVSGKCTMQPFSIAKASKLVLPPRLSRRIRRRAQRALFKYLNSFES